MKEEVFSLSAGNGLKVYGRINRAAKKAKKAVVLCHGLGCNMNDHHLQAGKYFFAERGYDVIRFNFYSGEDDARRIVDCTVGLHVKDLNRVLAHFAPAYGKLYAAGHSYGGLTVLAANSDKIAAASFWDSFFVPSESNPWLEYWRFSSELGEYLTCWPPVAQVVGAKFYKEQAGFTRAKLNAMAKKFAKPAQVLAAGGFPVNVPCQENMFAALGEKKEYKAIPGADHMFYEGNTAYELLENTHRWFERF